MSDEEIQPDPSVGEAARWCRRSSESRGSPFKLVENDPTAGTAAQMATPRDESPTTTPGIRPRALARPTGLASPDALIVPPELAGYELHLKNWLASHKDRRFVAKATGDELVLECLTVIGQSFWEEGVTATGIKRAIDANPKVKTVRVLIDSPGGDAFMGIAIQALLKRSGKRVEIEILGEASSAATAVAMAGDKISIHEGAMFMVHEASGGCWGSAADHRDTADVLTKLSASIVDLYVARTKRPRSEIEAMVKAETWMTARECLANGFADEVIPAKGAA